MLYSLSFSDTMEELCAMEPQLECEIKAKVERITVTTNSVNSPQDLMVVTWPRLHKATQEDGVLVKLIEQIERGFPGSQHEMDNDIREFHKHRFSLHVVDGVACYKGRLIIPVVLQPEIIAAIHAAHQGVSGMNNRVEQAVFWPGISVDIIKQGVFPPLAHGHCP